MVADSSSGKEKTPGDGTGKMVRTLLLVFVGMILCPVQYWELLPDDVDNTWVFALNYAAAHHLVPGRDFVWTSGPLAYLAAPMDIGNNLANGLIFQAVLWAVLLAVLWDLFFRGGFPLKNLVFFAIFMALSGPQFHQLPNPLGAGSLLLVGALIMLAHYRIRGGTWRFVGGLAMLGFIPLIQFVGVMMVAGVGLGIVTAILVQGGKYGLGEIGLAMAVPVSIAGIGYRLTMGSWRAVESYFRASTELASGYNLAMSVKSDPSAIFAGFGALVILAAAIILLAKSDWGAAQFIGLLCAVPLLVNVKHGIVRQDAHVVYIFGFAAVVMALFALVMTLDKQGAASLATAAILFAGLSVGYLSVVPWRTALAGVTGFRVPGLVWHALRFQNLRHELRAKAAKSYSEKDRIEPEILAVVQHEAVGALSLPYSNFGLTDLNLELYPVFQRYSAYTPQLDAMNAVWVRDRGPRYLIFDYRSIDGRNPWTETPAMMVEVYRWYETRLLGKFNVLLERRATPRFMRFESLGREEMRFAGPLRIPVSQEAVFWTMKCSLNSSGKLSALLFNVDTVTMVVRRVTRQNNAYRVLPGLLGAPSMGNYLPTNLPAFAAVLEAGPTPKFSVDQLTFEGPGISSYSPNCEVEVLRPVN